MFRKIKKTAIVFGCLMAALTLTKAPVSAATSEKLLGSIDWDTKVAADVNDFLNIRSKADADSEINGVLLPGRVATVVDVEGEWTKVKSGNITGYVLTKYTKSGDAARKEYIQNAGATGRVSGASALVIRESASTDAAKVTAVSEASALSLKSVDNGWYKVSFQDYSGYVLGKYIKESSPKGAITKAEYDKMNSSSADKKEETKSEKTTKTSDKKESSSKTEKSDDSKSGNGDYVIKCSDSELDMLAAIIQCEAGGESYKGQVAVGAVVVNRVKSSRYPNSVESVIKQKSQFSPVRSGRFSKVLKKGARSSCYKAAKAALSGESPVGNAKSFRAGHSKKGTQIGNQYFF